MGENGTATKGTERQSRTFRPSEIGFPCQYESRNTYASERHRRLLRTDGIF